MKLIDGQDYISDPRFTTVFERCKLCGTVTPYVTETNDEEYTRRKVTREGLVSSLLKHCYNCECQTIQVPIGYIMKENVESM